MSNLVKVHNLNAYPFDGKFRGQAVKIPPHQFIEMDYDDAVQFKSQYHQPKYDSGGVQDPKSYKYVEIDKEDRKRVLMQRGAVSKNDKNDKFVCHVCTKEFLTKNGLLTHIKKKHLDVMIDKDARDELIDNEEVESDET